MNKFLAVSLVVFLQAVQVAQGASADGKDVSGDASAATHRAVSAALGATPVDAATASGPLLDAVLRTARPFPGTAADLAAGLRRLPDILNRELAAAHAAGAGSATGAGGGSAPRVHATPEDTAAAVRILGAASIGAVNTPDAAGVYPLSKALDARNEPAIRGLLALGADPLLGRKQISRNVGGERTTVEIGLLEYLVVIQQGAVANLIMHALKDKDLPIKPNAIIPGPMGQCTTLMHVLSYGGKYQEYNLARLLSTPEGLNALSKKDFNGETPEFHLFDNPALQATMQRLREGYALFEAYAGTKAEPTPEDLGKMHPVAVRILTAGLGGGFASDYITIAVDIIQKYLVGRSVSHIEAGNKVAEILAYRQGRVQIGSRAHEDFIARYSAEAAIELPVEPATPVEVAGAAATGAGARAGGAVSSARGRETYNDLTWAVAGGRRDAVRIVLTANDLARPKWDVNAADGGGDTPLLVAAKGGDGDMITLLLSNGAKASVNTADTEGMTPLMHVVTQGKALSMVKVLLDVGADANLVDASGRTALMILASSDGEDTNKSLIALSLVEKMTPESINRVRGSTTALNHAVVRGNMKLVNLLMAVGADPLLGSIDGMGNLAFATAHRYGFLANFIMAKLNSRTLPINPDRIFEKGGTRKGPTLVHVIALGEVDPTGYTLIRNMTRLLGTAAGLRALSIRDEEDKLPEQIVSSDIVMDTGVKLKDHMKALREGFGLLMINLGKDVSNSKILLEKMKVAAEHISGIGTAGEFTEAQVAQARAVMTGYAALKLREAKELASQASRGQVGLYVSEVLGFLNKKSQAAKDKKAGVNDEIIEACQNLLAAYKEAEKQIGDTALARSIMRPLNVELRKLQAKRDLVIDGQMDWATNFPLLSMAEPVAAAADAGAGASGGAAAAAAEAVPPPFDIGKAALNLDTLEELLKAMKWTKREKKTKAASQYATACAKVLDEKINGVAVEIKAARLAAGDNEAIVNNEENPDFGITATAQKKNRKIFRDQCQKFVDRYPLDRMNEKTGKILALLRDALDNGIDIKILHGLLRYGSADLRGIYAEIKNIESGAELSTYDSGSRAGASVADSRFSPGAHKIDPVKGVAKAGGRAVSALGDLEERDGASLAGSDLGDLSDFSDGEEEDVSVLGAGLAIPAFELPDNLACAAGAGAGVDEVSHEDNLASLRRLFNRREWKHFSEDMHEFPALFRAFGERFSVSRTGPKINIIDNEAAAAMRMARIDPKNRANIAVDNLHATDARGGTGGPKKRLLKGVVEILSRAGIDLAAVEHKYGDAPAGGRGAE